MGNIFISPHQHDFLAARQAQSPEDIQNRLMLSFVKDIRENKCGLITWEKPHVG